MERTLIAHLPQAIGQKVKIQGFLHTLRDQKTMQFLILRDRSGMVQVAFYKKANPELAEQISRLTNESVLTIIGTVVENPIVKLGGLEVQLESLQVESLAEAPLPLDPTAEVLPSLDYRLDWRFLDMRRAPVTAFFEIQTTLEMAFREYWLQHGFVEIHPPN